MSLRDHESRTAEIGEPEPLPETTREKARRLVAGNAIDAADCEELWRMLGLHPDQNDPDGRAEQADRGSEVLSYTPPRLGRVQ